MESDKEGGGGRTSSSQEKLDVLPKVVLVIK
jgi:hypothetical protein